MAAAGCSYRARARALNSLHFRVVDERIVQGPLQIDRSMVHKVGQDGGTEGRGGGLELPPVERPQASLNGRVRNRLPVSANTAFATAGAIGGVPGSPAPPIFSVEGTITV